MRCSNDLFEVRRTLLGGDRRPGRTGPGGLQVPIILSYEVVFYGNARESVRVFKKKKKNIRVRVSERLGLLLRGGDSQISISISI